MRAVALAAIALVAGCGADGAGDGAPEAGVATVPTAGLAGGRPCRPAGEHGGRRFELCETTDAGRHGAVVVSDGQASEPVPLGSPDLRAEAPADQPLIGHWEWAAVSPDGRTLLLEWSAECEVPAAFLAPAAGGEPRSAAGPEPWFDSPPSRAFGWTTDGRAIVGVEGGPCSKQAERRLLLVAPDGSRESLPWSGEWPARSLEPRPADALD